MPRGMALGPPARFFLSHFENAQPRAQAGQRLETAGGDSQRVLQVHRPPTVFEERHVDPEPAR